jgi:hypothetical protein
MVIGRCSVASVVGVSLRAVLPARTSRPFPPDNLFPLSAAFPSFHPSDVRTSQIALASHMARTPQYLNTWEVHRKQLASLFSLPDSSGSSLFVARARTDRFAHSAFGTFDCDVPDFCQG